MKKEQMIIEQLDHLEQEVSLLADSARTLRELRDDLSPRVNEAVKVLITELAEIEADIQLEDLMSFLKNLIRNSRNLNWSLDQLKNLIDFLQTVEPLLKSAVPQAIYHLDQLERKGLFQVFSIMLGALQKIVETYKPQDIEQIGNGLVALVGVAKTLTTPPALNLLEKIAVVPSAVDLARAKEVGPFGILFALGNSEVRQGLGVLIEMTKGLSLLKDGDATGAGGATPSQNSEVPPAAEDQAEDK